MLKTVRQPVKQDQTTSTYSHDQLHGGGNNQLRGELAMNVVNINPVVAAIISSITFAAAIQIPGGCNSTTGVANLRDETSLKFFLAFGFSAASIFIHYLAVFYSGYVHTMQF